MNKQHIVNFINGLVLIVVGLVSFFLNETRPITALIGPIFGVIFLVSTKGMKEANKTIAHIVATLTLLFLIACIIQFVLSLDFPDIIARQRRLISFGTMGVSNLIAITYYVRRFIWIKKQSRLNKE